MRSFLGGLAGALVAFILALAVPAVAQLTVPFNMPATACTNQFIRSIAAVTGAGTCATASLTADVTGVLPIANGGTNDSGTAWTTYTPTVTPIGGTCTSCAATGRYKVIGKTMFLQASLTVTTAGTAVAASMNLGTGTANAIFGLSCVDDSVGTAATVPQCYINSGTTAITLSPTAAVFITGHVYAVSGVIELQ